MTSPVFKVTCGRDQRPAFFRNYDDAAAYAGARGEGEPEMLEPGEVVDALNAYANAPEPCFYRVTYNSGKGARFMWFTDFEAAEAYTAKVKGILVPFSLLRVELVLNFYADGAPRGGD